MLDPAVMRQPAVGELQHFTIGWCRSSGMTTTSASSSLLSIIAR
jgi:hypothetical protein